MYIHTHDIRVDGIRSKADHIGHIKEKDVKPRVHG